jgi:hypothetical protein
LTARSNITVTANHEAAEVNGSDLRPQQPSEIDQ